MKTPLFIAALAALAASSSPASGQQAQQRRDVDTFIQGKWYLDAGLIGASGAAFLAGTFALKPSLAQRAPLDGLGHRARSEPFEIASDTVLAAGFFGSLVMARSIERGEGRQGLDQWRAPIVLAESALVASAVVHLAKNALGVCRPRDWRQDQRRCDPDQGEVIKGAEARTDEAHRSFPSGHTAPAAALAGASLGLWLLPDRRRPEFASLTAVTGVVALSMVALRPLAGAHSWVDTSTGFLIGASSGLLVSYLHTRTVTDTAVSVSASPVQISLASSF